MERINRMQFLNHSVRNAAGVTLGTRAPDLFSGRAFGANNKVAPALIGAGPRENGKIQL